MHHIPNLAVSGLHQFNKRFSGFVSFAMTYVAHSTEVSRSAEEDGFGVQASLG
jgi:hypothetical protein